jgi:phospholipid N-methyltransferase
VKGERNVKKSFTFERIEFIFRNIFLGFLVWSFFNTIITIVRESTIGLIIGITSIVMSWMFNDIISTKKLYDMEFGKYTKIIAWLIEVIAIFCLFLLFGIGF